MEYKYKQVDKYKNMKCDRCRVAIGLFRHNSGWRCSSCIWEERNMLIDCVNKFLNCSQNQPLSYYIEMLTKTIKHVERH